jgi:hypothetical protein
VTYNNGLSCYLTPISEVLSQTSGTKEIMWNFSLFKGERRLTLKDNPHFYEKLPTSVEIYEGQFRTEPIDTFHHDKISVLTDNPRLTGRVFLDTAKEKRAFGNVWVPKEAIIFKGLFHSYISLSSSPLTPCQTSMENLKAKASSEKLFKTLPTYGVLRSHLCQTPRCRRSLIKAAHCLPCLRHRRLHQQDR